jgi:hypothetical protein
VSDLFSTLTAGFSRFVLAWLMPSVVTVTTFAIFIFPEIAHNPIIAPLSRAAHKNAFTGTLVFAFSVVLTSLIFAFTSLPLNRLLEGYTLPPGLRRRWRRRQIRRYITLQRSYRRLPARFGDVRGLVQEQLSLYPRYEEQILPTRLGNAYKAIETYGVNRFSLDGQTFHFELLGVAPERLRRDIEDTRAQVDFFIGFVGQLGLLSIVSIAIAVSSQSGTALLIGLLSAVLARLAYSAALRNMTDVRYAMQALTHIARNGLASALGYRLPQTMERERQMWAAWTRYVAGGARALQAFDTERTSSDGTRDG